MTQFNVKIFVSPSTLQWLREEYGKLFFQSPHNFDFDHDEKYTHDYECDEYSYSVGRRNREIERVDEGIIEEIDEYISYNFDDENNNDEENEEDKPEETKGQIAKREIIEAFEEFRKIREEYTQEAEKYEAFYKEKMGIFLDSFPNFNMTHQFVDNDKCEVTFESFETKEDDDNGEYYEYVRNPFFLVVFLQKYIKQFGPNTPIKFKYFENSTRAARKDAGVISVDYFDVKIITLDDFMKKV